MKYQKPQILVKWGRATSFIPKTPVPIPHFLPFSIELMAASSSSSAAAKTGDEAEKKAPVHEVLEEDDEFEVSAMLRGERGWKRRNDVAA